MYIKRDIEEKVFDWIAEREIIAIIGPRQSGKTTLMDRIKERAIAERGYDENHVVFISFEDEIERLKFEGDPSSYVQAHLMDSGMHLFLLDEVQYVKNAGRCLKLIFDRFHERVKFVMTGSSSPDLKGIGGSLVGRSVFFELYPFSFGEFLLTKDEKLYRYHAERAIDPEGPISDDEPVLLDRLNEYLKEYITYGGLPRVVLLEDIGKKRTLLKQLVTLYIEKDVLKVHGSAFRNDALRVVQYLAFNCCGLLNKDTISSELGISVKKVQETLDVLEDSFLIRRIRPYFGNLSTELRKMSKVYFVDSGIRNVLSEDFVFSREKGYLLENHIFSELNRKVGSLKYWRTTAKAEVDFVFRDRVPIEVKSSPRISRSLRSFITAYDPKRALIVNYDTMERTMIDRTEIAIVPAAMLQAN